MTTQSKTTTQQHTAGRLERKYRGIARRCCEHALAVTTEHDVFYLPITRKQALECLAAGMVAGEHAERPGVCFIDKVDYEAQLNGED